MHFASENVEDVCVEISRCDLDLSLYIRRDNIFGICILVFSILQYLNMLHSK